MTSPHARSNKPSDTASGTMRIGCVSFLNAIPLIEGIDTIDLPADMARPVVKCDVPSRLLDDLLGGEVDVALCPVIDYFKSPQPLSVVPAGGICSNGVTFTVRLYSRVPIGAVTTVHADTDSHTSVALLRVLLREMFDLSPRLIDYHAREQVADHKLVDKPETMLLIGDKVVTDSPLAVEYPHQLDLGEAWKAHTGLPFVFAVWMCREGVDVGQVPAVLDAVRRANLKRLDALADAFAPGHGWPTDLARKYLGGYLRYAIGDDELAAIRLFGERAAAAGIVAQPRDLSLVPVSDR